MARPFNPDLTRNWKLSLPATLAGKIDFVLEDPVTRKPIYGSRNKLVAALLEQWLARESGKAEAELPAIPTLAQLREASY